MIDKPNVEKSGITRRNFMNGFAMGLTAGTTLSPFELLAMNPPTSTDDRGGLESWSPLWSPY